MADPFRISRFVHWFLLVGGRRLYEDVFQLHSEAGRAALLNRRIALLDDGADEPLPSIFLRFVRESLHPRWMSDENAVFVESLLRYTTVTHLARHTMLLRHHLRPGVFNDQARVGPPLSGWVHLWPAIGEQTQLRFWDPLAKRWTPPLAAPVFRMTPDLSFFELVDDGVAARQQAIKREADPSYRIPPGDGIWASSAVRVYGVPAQGPADGKIIVPE
jgi:hypothetical protein